MNNTERNIAVTRTRFRNLILPAVSLQTFEDLDSYGSL